VPEGWHSSFWAQYVSRMPAKQWPEYWVLLIDILGFSRRISSPHKRQELVAVYILLVRGLSEVEGSEGSRKQRA
jgi:hypothetical protein